MQSISHYQALLLGQQSMTEKDTTKPYPYLAELVLALSCIAVPSKISQPPNF